MKTGTQKLDPRFSPSIIGECNFAQKSHGVVVFSGRQPDGCSTPIFRQVPRPSAFGNPRVRLPWGICTADG